MMTLQVRLQYRIILTTIGRSVNGVISVFGAIG